MTTTTTKPKLWVPGDWNAFFGFGTNILVNLLTLTGNAPIQVQSFLINGVAYPVTWNSFSNWTIRLPISSPYVTDRVGSPVTLTIPFATVSLSTGAFNFFAAS